MTIKELEEYCIDRGIKMLNRAMEHEGEPNVSEYYNGKANAFLWIAACIQNDSFEGKVIRNDE